MLTSLNVIVSKNCSSFYFRSALYSCSSLGADHCSLDRGWHKSVSSLRGSLWSELADWRWRRGIPCKRAARSDSWFPLSLPILSRLLVDKPGTSGPPFGHVSGHRTSRWQPHLPSDAPLSPLRPHYLCRLFLFFDQGGGDTGCCGLQLDHCQKSQECGAAGGWYFLGGRKGWESFQKEHQLLEDVVGPRKW